MYSVIKRGRTRRIGEPFWHKRSRRQTRPCSPCRSLLKQRCCGCLRGGAVAPKPWRTRCGTGSSVVACRAARKTANRCTRQKTRLGAEGGTRPNRFGRHPSTREGGRKKSPLRKNGTHTTLASGPRKTNERTTHLLFCHFWEVCGALMTLLDLDLDKDAPRTRGIASGGTR